MPHTALASTSIRSESKKHEVALLCRRFVDWKNPIFNTEKRTHFSSTHPYSELKKSWLSYNPKIPLESYRYFLHKLALTTWNAAGVDIYFNPVHPSDQGAGSLSKNLIRALRRYQWLIPIDDDDWIAPKLPSQLMSHLSHSEKIELAYWNTAGIHFSDGRSIMNELIQPYLPKSDKIIYSCGYALSKSINESLNDNQLEDILMHHGQASSLASQVEAIHINSLSAVHLRHVATAGSASQQDLNRKIGRITAPKILNKDPGGIFFWIDPPREFAWAKPYFNQLIEGHNQLSKIDDPTM